ncbi:response regulator [Mesorhizobium sp. B3-2-1]|uniref:phosphorylase family protein n=1 Tax=Mesorhizobium sp. B3-2-1 TaxID=2589891 RepID=UPI00112ABB58|nr:response regulator [Mesorhizobium sp. B3-2-1]TPI26811.1 response regulator [Mesorhizobium sp. B3-2-1]
MIKILLVEDEPEKARLVSTALMEVSGVGPESITRCSSEVEAKQALKRTYFDLMVLDINIPSRTDRHIRTGGGLEILKAVYSKPVYNIPTYVIGLSAYEDGIKEAKKGFINPLWKVLRFAPDEADWSVALKLATEFIIKGKRLPPVTDGNSFHSTLGIVVGLEDVELESVLALLEESQQVSVPHDPTRYFKGKFRSGKREIDVVLVAATKMGLVNSAIVATRLIENFRPKYLAMCGICAGVREKTGLGDILVADPCWDWGSGKVTTGKNGAAMFAAAPYPWRLNPDLRKVAKDISSDATWLEELYLGWHEGRPENKPKVLIEAVASGASVLQRKAAMDAIKLQHKNLIGVEMEIYAVLSAAELASAPRPIAVAAKSVCDFGEEDKDGKAQRFAAYTSASFIRELAFRAMVCESDYSDD